MTMRAMGPFNGILPEASGQFVGYLRDPSTFPYLNYVQLVPAPETQFRYWVMNSDQAARLPYLNAYDWGWDDYRPTHKEETVDGEWLHDRVNRYDFGYTIGEETIRTWSKAGIDAKSLHDEVTRSKAALHRAARAVNTLRDASWPTNHSSALLTLTGGTAYWDQSVGVQLDAAGDEDPRWLVIKQSLNKIKRRIQLATKGVVGRQDLFCIIPPTVAEAISKSGEMNEALKQSQFAKELTDLPPGMARNTEDWNLPPRYAGFNFIVEDTVRVKINRQADGSLADVTSTSEVDYILDSDTVYFASRPGGLDGVAGTRSFSTLQCWTWNGEGRVEAFSEPKHQLIDGHYVMEDKYVTPSLISGFKLTDVLST